jgi:hypothetical protein
MSLGHSEGKYKSNSIFLMEIGPDRALREDTSPQEIHKARKENLRGRFAGANTTAWGTISKVVEDFAKIVSKVL